MKMPLNKEGQWSPWKEFLPLMSKIEIPHCYFSDPIDQKQVEVQIHHFCDASEIGYGTVSYLRITHLDKTISCSFILAKSRNAPVRAPTIPRMELQSSVLAVCMDKFIQAELDLPVNKTGLTDSTITLFFVSNESKRFKTYLTNRLNETPQSSDKEQWRHCPGKMNPADDCSRGLDAQQLLDNDTWLKGPQFFWQTEDHWPNSEIANVPDEQLEVKKEQRSSRQT